MELIEVTGQPCSGKTSFISKEALINSSITKYKHKRKITNFFSGICYLGLSRLKVIFFWSLKEDVPFLFKLNIFRNTILKFGIFKKQYKFREHSSKKVYIDEGVSHLPFLFLKTDTQKVLSFISEELLKIKVIFFMSPSHLIIKERLINRGHKRLRHITLKSFIERNMEIEDIILQKYPELCSELKLNKNVEDS